MALELEGTRMMNLVRFRRPWQEGEGRRQVIGSHDLPYREEHAIALAELNAARAARAEQAASNEPAAEREKREKHIAQSQPKE